MNNIQYQVSQLDVTEHVVYGAGVIFNSWPEEHQITDVMEGIRTALKEVASGDIFWHIAKKEEGWHLSGNISNEVISNPVKETPVNSKSSTMEV